MSALVRSVGSFCSCFLWGSDSLGSKGPTSNKVDQQKVSICGQSPGTSASKPLSRRISASSRALSRSFAGRINSLVASCLLGVLLLPKTATAASTFFSVLVDGEIFLIEASTACVKKHFLKALPAFWEFFNSEIWGVASSTEFSRNCPEGDIGLRGSVFVYDNSTSIPTCFSPQQVKVCSAAAAAEIWCEERFPLMLLSSVAGASTLVFYSILCCKWLVSR